MARMGKLDYSKLAEFTNKVEQSLSKEEINLFMEACAKELTARLLSKVIKRTPVGEYPSKSGKKGGTLRRGWTAEKNQAVTTYVNSLTINHNGDSYTIEIVNPVEYASYVEYGHRTRNHKGWVEGRFMLTISSQELQEAAPAILEKKLKRKLGEVFG